MIKKRGKTKGDLGFPNKNVKFSSFFVFQLRDEEDEEVKELLEQKKKIRTNIDLCKK